MQIVFDARCTGSWWLVTSVSPAGHEQPSRPRVTKRRAQTRARLLEAGYKVWARQGFWQTRVEEICAEAGYTRGAFYSNFDSLDDLFFALYEQRCGQITAQVTAVLADGGGDDSSAATLVERTAAALPLDREWLMIKAEYLLHAARNPAIAGRLAVYQDKLRTAIEHRLRQAGDRITLPGPLAGIPDAARAAIAVYEGAATQYLLDGDEKAAREWLARLLTITLNR